MKHAIALGPISDITSVQREMLKLAVAVNNLANENSDSITAQVAAINAAITEIEAQLNTLKASRLLTFGGHITGVPYNGTEPVIVGSDGTPYPKPNTLAARDDAGSVEFNEVLAHGKVTSDKVFDKNAVQILDIQQAAVADVIATSGSAGGSLVIAGLDADPATKADVRVALSSLNTIIGQIADILATQASIITAINADLAGERAHGLIHA